MDSYQNGSSTNGKLLHDIHSVGFADLVSQKSIQTEEDVEKYKKLNYAFTITEAQFRKSCSVDPACIWYLPSLVTFGVYFNPETLAICYFPVEMAALKCISWESFEQAVEKAEQNAAQGEFHAAMLSVPDQLRLEYLELLLRRKADVIPNLYSFFLQVYQTSNFGFSKTAQDLFSLVLSKRTEQELAEVQSRLAPLPDTFTVYRGCGVLSADVDETYSWSTDVNVAYAFALRNSVGGASILSGQVRKGDVIDALDDRSEKEVLVPPGKVSDISRVELLGFDAIEDISANILILYQKYRDRIPTLQFERGGKGPHGREHAVRVLFLALFIADKLGLSTADCRILAEAAIYHDTKRMNDYDDPEHGLRARRYYEQNGNANPAVGFLIEYHNQPDEAGEEEIFRNRQLSRKRTRVQRLFHVFKDADALDRLRFGLSDLDVNQLRLPISKQLPMVAMLCLRYLTL